MYTSTYQKTLLICTLTIAGLLSVYGFQNSINTPVLDNPQKIILPISSIWVNSVYWSTGTTNINNCITDPEIQFFMYHYIRDHDPRDNIFTTDLSVSPANFRLQMNHIQSLRKEWRIYTMNGSDFIAAKERKCYPAKRIWIFTSDDGWSDTYTNLFPIATEYNIPFFLGIITNRLDTPGFVTTNQIQEISKNPLFTISSHSITHNEQNKMDKNNETHEMCESKNILEKILWITVDSYIYPEWKMSKNSEEIAELCWYNIAWSTGYGKKWDLSDTQKFNINRIRIHNTTSIHLFDDILNWKH